MSAEQHLVQPGTIPAPDSYSIKVTKDGPYLVSGTPPLQQKIIEQDASRHSWSYGDGQAFQMAEGARLCRCGMSTTAPFCDGSHQRSDVDLRETASFAPLLENSTVIQGPTRSLTDNEAYCAFGRFCDAGDRIWNQVSEGGEDSDQLTERMAHHCPAGRLLVFDNATGKPIEDRTEPSLGLIVDPALGVSGPIMVCGGIRVESASGRSYEIRNRQALCRCGQSTNKPFCDGTHASMKFHDGIEAPGKR